MMMIILAPYSRMTPPAAYSGTTRSRMVNAHQSTNFHPNDIFDGAALRRVFFKLKIDGPTKEEFLKIFALVAKAKKMPLDEPTLIHLMTKKYPEVNHLYANFHAIFLIDQMRAVCDFEGIPYQMTPDLIDRAWENLYVKQEEIAH